jgi:simple sugar transport system permease protein
MDDFIVGLIAATLRVATPLLLATLGELYAERAGILNLGIEGTMFLGAFVGFVVADKTSSLGVGLAAAIGGGIIRHFDALLRFVRREPTRVRTGDHVIAHRIIVVWISPGIW